MILLSVQWIEKYSCHTAATGVPPTQAAAEASTQGKRRINLATPSGEWNDPLCREIAQVRPLRGHPTISVLNHNLDSAD
jgi:hypothetical protein